MLYEIVICLISVLPSEGHPQVLVIGAGASGLSAAVKLREQNISVEVLEAEGRIGGRVHSVEFGDGVVDLGAQWIGGDNVVSRLVEGLDLIDNSTELEYKMACSDGSDITQLGRELYGLDWELFAKAGTQEVNAVLGSFITIEYKAKVLELYGNDTKKLEVALAALDTFAHLVNCVQGSFTWYDIAAKTSFEKSEGTEYSTWKGRGYKTFLEVLLKPYPDLQIRLNKEVKQISWDQSLVEVSCSDGSTYKAEHVIFTPSIGVLKHDYENLFVPKLPAKKVEAIEATGYGSVAKVMLEFSEKWWDEEDFASRNFVWLKEDREKLVEGFPLGPNKNNKSWLLSYMGLMTAENNPKVLISFLTGTIEPEIEDLKDEELIDGMTFVLRKFYGHKYNITRPIKLLRENWYRNPHFRGIASYETVSSRQLKPTNFELLMEPLSSSGIPRVLFAGEATNSKHHASVFGAVETGYREAERVISLLGKGSK